MIVLRNEYTNYTRNADAKIELLREVIERLQSGEQVDVKKLLGTGDETKEREWEEGEIFPSGACVVMDINRLFCEVLREIEKEDSFWHSKSKREQSQRDLETDKLNEGTSNCSSLSEKEVPNSDNGSTHASPDEVSVPKQTQPPRPFNFY
jgi:hypothetical protein